MEMIRILITGFEIFGENEVNPTEVIVNKYDPRPGEISSDHETTIDRMVLPVDTGAPEVLKEHLKGSEFDLVLHMGLHERSRYIRLERRARNLMDFRIPDNRGEQIRGRQIVDGGPDALFTSVQLDPIALSLSESEIPAVISFSAGLYLCNMVYYESLRWQSMNDPGAKVLFVHFPTFDVLDVENALRAVSIIIRGCLDF